MLEHLIDQGGVQDDGATPETPNSRRPAVIAAAAITALLLVGAGGVCYRSEQVLTRTREVALPVIRAPIGDSQAIAEGERLGVIRGCVGCHSTSLSGKVAFDLPGLYRLISANLTTGHGGIGNYSDGYLARAIRLGVRHDDRGVFGMPSATFFALDDVDLSLILAWMRSKPPATRTLPDHTFRWKARWSLVTGALHSVGDSLPTAPTPPRAPPYGPTPEYGAYLARTICTECHGARLEGTTSSPALSLVAGYDSLQFIDAIIYGQARDGRLLKRTMPIERYDALLPEERTALYLYLHALRGPAAW